MANTSRTISYDALLTSTREKLHKSGAVQDAILEAIPTLDALRKNGAYQVKTKGGEVIRISMFNEKNTTGTSYSGYEKGVITPQDEFTIAYDQWRQYQWNTAISGIELFKNGGGAERIFDLLMEKEKATIGSATEDINQDLWDVAGLGTDGSTGNGGKNINSIPLLIQADPTDGQDVHGIDQSAESWFQNRYKDVDTITTYVAYMNAIRNLVNTCNRGRGGGMADLGIFDQVSYELFEQSMDPKIRYTSSEAATPGFNSINYKGMKLLWDVYVPDAGAGTNGGPSTTLGDGALYILNSKTLKFYVGEGFDFSPTPFVKMHFDAQDAQSSLTLLYAQLITDSRRNNGVLINIPTSLT